MPDPTADALREDNRRLREALSKMCSTCPDCGGLSTTPVQDYGRKPPGEGGTPKLAAAACGYCGPGRAALARSARELGGPRGDR